MPIRLGLGITLDRSQSLYGTGTAAGRLLGSEPAGFAIDFANDSALIRWPSSPASQYSGNIAGLLSASVLSFSRASTATYFDANGVMQTASNDVLRRTYDPSTLAALGYLPEPQRTNLFTSSQVFSTGWSQNVSPTITDNAAAAPDGTTTAARFDFSASASSGVFKLVTLSASTAYTVSVFVKANTGANRVRLTLDGPAFSGTIIADWNTVTGAIVSTSGSPVTTAKYYGNGWWRFALTGTTTSAASGGGTIYSGSASANSAYIWGAQLEAGSYPSSYIPTTSSAVTRAADALSADLSKLPFSSSVGSVIAIAQPSPDTASNGFGLAQLDDGSDNNRIGLTNGAAGSKIARATVVNSGSADADISSASNAAASRFKQALAWAANDIEMVVGGVASTKDTSCAVPSGLTTLRIGSKVAANTQWSAPAESLVYIPRRLGQGEMIARTS